ncbi:MAG: hypothetical protein ACRDD1_00160, partial [Planctomycetia bacterium]
NGSGRFHLREADLYRLPVVLDLFDLLNFQSPNGQAFDEVDCSFHLRDRMMILHKLDLQGPSLSLVSEEEGRMNMETLQLDVRLRPRWGPRVGRGRLNIPFVTPAVDQTADQLMTIRVQGRLDEPVISPELIPGAKRILDGPAKAIGNIGRGLGADPRSER